MTVHRIILDMKVNRRGEMYVTASEMISVIVDPPRAHFNFPASNSRGVVNFMVMMANSIRQEEYKYNLKRESD